NSYAALHPVMFSKLEIAKQEKGKHIFHPDPVPPHPYAKSIALIKSWQIEVRAYDKHDTKYLQRKNKIIGSKRPADAVRGDIGGRNPCQRIDNNVVRNKRNFDSFHKLKFNRFQNADDGLIKQFNLVGIEVDKANEGDKQI